MPRFFYFVPVDLKNWSPAITELIHTLMTTGRWVFPALLFSEPFHLKGFCLPVDVWSMASSASWRFSVLFALVPVTLLLDQFGSCVREPADAGFRQLRVGQWLELHHGDEALDPLTMVIGHRPQPVADGVHLLIPVGNALPRCEFWRICRCWAAAYCELPAVRSACGVIQHAWLERPSLRQDVAWCRSCRRSNSSAESCAIRLVSARFDLIFAISTGWP